MRSTCGIRWSTVAGPCTGRSLLAAASLLAWVDCRPARADVDQSMHSAVPAPDGFVFVRAGQYLMGSPDTEVGRDGDETQHSVILTRDLFVGVTEVTQSEWIHFMAYNPSRFSTCGGLCPVERVNWFEAVEFANARSRAENLEECYALTNCRGSLAAGDYRCRTVDSLGAVCEGYRLPTEAEWEYVARAGSTDERYGGLSAIAWYDPSSGGETHPVAGLAPNAWGLYDVMGNVWEWTDDWFAPYGTTTINPQGPARGFSKVYRGGSWDYGHRVIRSAYRGIDEPHVRAPDVGLRLVRTVVASAAP